MGQNNYNLQQNEPGFAGQPVDARDCRVRSLQNAGGTTTSRTILVSNNAGAGSTYTIDVTWNGITESFSYESDGGDGVNDIAAGLEAAADANPVLGGVLEASVATATVTLSGRIKGLDFSIAAATNSADLTLGGSAASAASDILPGRAVIELDSDPGNGRLPSTADDTLKVVTATYGGTFTAGDLYVVSLLADLDFDGIPEVYTAQTVGITSLAVTTDLLMQGLDRQLPANTIAVTDTATTVVATSELPNLDFTLTATVTDATSGASGQTVAISETALVALPFAGVAMLDRGRPGNSSGQFPYIAGDTINVVEEGVVFVELDAGITPSLGDPVFFRCVASGSEVLGAFRDAQDADDCCFLPPSRARWVNSSAYSVNGVRVAALDIKRR